MGAEGGKREVVGAVVLALEGGGGEVERGGNVTGLKGRGCGAEAAHREFEVVDAGPRVGGRGRVGHDGGTEDRGGPPGRRGGEEYEQRKEKERGRRRGEREDASAAWERVVVVAARHSGFRRVAASEWREN